MANRREQKKQRAWIGSKSWLQQGEKVENITDRAKNKDDNCKVTIEGIRDIGQ
jgi:anti-sigma factor ChrR (cupin superfamily)